MVDTPPTKDLIKGVSMRIIYNDEQSIEFQDVNDSEKVTIKSLFKDYNDDYKPTEIDWGLPKGNEM